MKNCASLLRVNVKVAYVQASTDPEYQALLAKQSELQGAGMAAASDPLSQQQKEAGLASVFKRDDENLARRQAMIALKRGSTALSSLLNARPIRADRMASSGKIASL